MTALENVQVGMQPRLKSGVVASIVHWPKQQREERASEDKARELLSFVGLKRYYELSSNLPYGDQRRLEIARALASEPKLLLLDEPTAGMNPQESEELRGLMETLRAERGISVLLIEHDMRVVMNVSDHITVLDYGEKIAEGKPQEVRTDPRVIEAYLGEPGVILQVEDIHTFYGSIEALKGISIEVKEGEVVTLIGSNGAGKSTTLRSISGLNAPKTGKIIYDGKEIQGTPAHEVAALGIAQAPEGRRIFPRLTVRREPRHGRVPALQPDGDRAATASACSSCSRASRSARTRRAGRCRAASSRCSPWAGR